MRTHASEASPRSTRGSSRASKPRAKRAREGGGGSGRDSEPRGDKAPRDHEPRGAKVPRDHEPRGAKVPRDRHPSNLITVFREARGAPPLDGRAVKRRADRMLTELGETRAELSVMLTNDETIFELNAKHRKKHKATDVLSFPMDENGEGPNASVRLLGDVVISLDTAEKQARQRRRPLMAEVTHLLAHGILHLVGFDHRTDKEEREMNAAAGKLIRAASGGRPLSRS